MPGHIQRRAAAAIWHPLHGGKARNADCDSSLCQALIVESLFQTSDTACAAQGSVHGDLGSVQQSQDRGQPEEYHHTSDIMQGLGQDMQ